MQIVTGGKGVSLMLRSYKPAASSELPNQMVLINRLRGWVGHNDNQNPAKLADYMVSITII